MWRHIVKEEDLLQGQENELKVENSFGEKNWVTSHLPELRGGVATPIGGGANGLWMGGVMSGVPVPENQQKRFYKMAANILGNMTGHVT